MRVLSLPEGGGGETQKSPRGRNATGYSDLGGQLFGQKSGLDRAIRNAVGTCPILSNRPERGSKRKSDLSVCMVLAVGPAGARNLRIHMTSQAGNSLVLQRRLRRAYINSG